jgi:hypothetical protein
LRNLRSRVKELGTDPARGFIRREGIGGARIEQALGRRIARSPDVAVDFLDERLGPISLKGPVPRGKGSYEGLAKSAIKDANYNTATKTLYVDLYRLNPAARERVREMIEAGTKGANKDIRYLE